jgi:hypothetical protein
MDKLFICLPKLTDSEKDLLRAHSGCFKCRRFNAGHGSNAPTCPGFPSGNGYKTITRFADAIGRPAVKPAPSASSKGKMIASLLETMESEGEEAVAVFAPSAVLGNGTESGELDAVSDLAPLKCKHFVWKCFIEGPSTEFPLKVYSLVDNGCHLVLICPDIVEKLGLPTFSLPTPEPIAVAIKDSKEKEKMILSKFVILEPTLLDRTWTSCRVCALITPNLCMPMIFSLPFLSHNNIITDHALRSCIDKKNSYNLLHPDIVTPPIKTLRPKEKHQQLKEFKKSMIDELTTLCESRHRLIDSNSGEAQRIELCWCDQETDQDLSTP